MNSHMTDTDMIRNDGYKPRYCDGHREERDRDYEDYGTFRKRYRPCCRHDPRKSERYPNCPESHIEEQMDEIVQSSVNIFSNEEIQNLLTDY